MQCSSCGVTLPDGAKFCGFCGTTQTAPAPAEPVYQAPAEPAYQAPAEPAYQAPAEPVYQAPAQPAYQQPAYQQAPAQPAYQEPAYPQQPAAQQQPAADARPPKGSDYAPIGTLGYIGYFILFSIPIIGQILLIVFAFSKKGNANRRALARAMFVFLVLGLISSIVLGITMGATIKTMASAAGLEGGVFSWNLGNGNREAPENNGGDGGGGDPAQFGGTGDGGGSPQTPEPGEYNYGEGTLFTSQWPDNEFTRQVPKPDYDVTYGGVTDTEFVALGGNATVKDLRDYAKKLQRAGFTKNADTTDESAFGITTYSYKADNGKGWQVEISYVSMMNVNTITIRKLGNFG